MTFALFLLALWRCFGGHVIVCFFESRQADRGVHYLRVASVGVPFAVEGNYKGLDGVRLVRGFQDGGTGNLKRTVRRIRRAQRFYCVNSHTSGLVSRLLFIDDFFDTQDGVRQNSLSL